MGNASQHVCPANYHQRAVQAELKWANRTMPPSGGGFCAEEQYFLVSHTRRLINAEDGYLTSRTEAPRAAKRLHQPRPRRSANHLRTPSVQHHVLVATPESLLATLRLRCHTLIAQAIQRCTIWIYKTWYSTVMVAKAGICLWHDLRREPRVPKALPSIRTRPAGSTELVDHFIGDDGHRCHESLLLTINDPDRR